MDPPAGSGLENERSDGVREAVCDPARENAVGLEQKPSVQPLGEELRREERPEIRADREKEQVRKEEDGGLDDVPHAKPQLPNEVAPEKAAKEDLLAERDVESLVAQREQERVGSRGPPRVSGRGDIRVFEEVTRQDDRLDTEEQQARNDAQDEP